MLFRRLGAGAATAALLATLTAFVPAAAIAKTGRHAKPTPHSKPTPHYYLALGDSLSQGIQPLGTNYQIIETKQGYADQLEAHYSKRIKGLTLVDLGCPGDTTGSMLNGGAGVAGNATGAAEFNCDRKGGSQVAAAVAFLKTHHKKGEVPLITVDIGANDVDGCVTQTNVIGCAEAGIGTIEANTPKILAALKSAAPKGTVFAAMNLYDPILAYELQPTTSPDYALGSLSLGLAQDVNTAIAAADTKAGFKTADVADAFDTNVTADTGQFDGQAVPQDLAEICDLTWMCPAAPQPPNIHANATGYRVIAGAFESVIGRL